MQTDYGKQRAETVEAGPPEDQASVSDRMQHAALTIAQQYRTWRFVVEFAVVVSAFCAVLQLLRS
jgi:hypothetical protein